FSQLGARPGAIFIFALAADLCLVALVLLDEKLFAAHLAGGFVAFGLLAAWTVGCLTNELLNLGLGFYLLFAILHSVFPIVLQRLRSDVALAWWAHLFPPLALVLIMVPILKISQVSFLVWPCVLLVDVLAIGLAVLTASLLSIVAVLVLTIVATAIWIFEI